MCMHAELLVQQQRRVCADYYNLSRFKLKDMCRSVKWEMFLYGDMTIIVDRDFVVVLLRGVPPPRFFIRLGNGSHTFYVVPAF